MTFARFGFYRASRLAAFQREGYADYVAFARPMDLHAGREALRRGASEMDVGRSGLYRRYELLVAYLLERRGMDAWTLLARPLARREVEGLLAHDSDLDGRHPSRSERVP